MIGKTVSHYKITEKLGEGGMGVVYRAHDIKLNREVALKFLPPGLAAGDTDRERFLREARAAAALNHPNVCVIYEIDDRGEHPFIAMELIEGTTLRELLREGPLETETVMDYSLQIAGALNAAHQKGIVHRDIKSENIMVTSSGRIKVTDFGLAKILGAVRITRSSSTLGTIAYMPPEHLTGEEVDARADIFSFGVLLYEMLTGRLPFSGEYDSAMIYSILNEEPEPVQKYRTGISSEMLHLLGRALEKDPGQRYQSAADMMIDLKRMKRDTGSVSRAGTDSGYQEKSHYGGTWRRKKGIVYIIAAIVLAAAAISFFMLRGSGPGYIENRVVAVPLENRTGDESLDILGEMAADMMASSMSQVRYIETVPHVSVIEGYSNRENHPSPLAIAARHRAGVLITGAYYLQEGELIFRSSIMDAAGEKLIQGLAPVTGSPENPQDAVEVLCNRILGVLAVEFGSGMPTVHVYVPSFDAYKEFMIGVESFGKDYDKARKHFFRALEMDSAFHAVNLWVATSYANQGRWAEADSIFQILNGQREKLKEWERLILDWGMANVSGNILKELKILKQAEALAPENVNNKYLIGLAARDQNQPRLTVSTFEKVNFHEVKKHARVTWWLEVLLSAHYMLGDYEEAMEVLELRKSEYPDLVSNLEFEAVLRAVRGEIEEVKRVIDESFQLSESAPEMVLIAAASALRVHGYDDAADQVCERALKWLRSRTAGDYRYSMARILYLDGHWEEADRFFEELRREYPDDINYLGYAGAAAARVGKVDEARRVIDQLYNRKERYMFGANLHWCARIYSILGEKRRAVDLLREAYGRGYGYGMDELLIIDFEPLRDYQPYIELIRPKG
ncbi:MAG: serine/threonine-protein kinase [Candidatus Krumholzibacteriales bacterium]